MRHILLIFVLLLMTVCSFSQDEITLFNSSGKAVAYIDTDDDELPIYLWNGKPVAYLSKSYGDFQVYGFNGKHLGWFEKGVIRDIDGDAIGATKRAVGVITEIEPIKSIKEIKPIKSIKEIATIKPIFSLSWSRTNFKLFLLVGVDD